MSKPKIYYKEPVFRPPSEGYSLLIQATEGCTFRCTFCYPYMKKQFKIRKLEEIKKDIDAAKEIYGNSVKKIFLLDGNAFVMKPQTIIDISKYCYRVHKNLKQISAYAHAKDILRKSDEELKAIVDSGFNLIYLGIETGDRELLNEVNKKTTPEEIIEAAQKLYKAGITLSGTIILGLAGSDQNASNKHALATAQLINQMNPPKNIKLWYIAALTLMLPPDTEIKKKEETGNFTTISTEDALKELRIIIENTSNELHDCVFRSNHASNYLPLRGILSQDKKEIINTIDYGLKHPEKLRPSYLRGL